MAYINSFTYDIFISYSRLDNSPVFNEQTGWVEQFYGNLKMLLARRIGSLDAIRFWWDKKKLDGSHLFDQAIVDGIKRSAIMICLSSTAYLKSEYCRKELDLFYKKAQEEKTGLSAVNRSRIINVLLNNIPYKKWPLELTGATGFPFHDADDEHDLGDPLDASDSRYRKNLQDLRDAIISMIDDFPKKNGNALTD